MMNTDSSSSSSSHPARMTYMMRSPSTASLQSSTPSTTTSPPQMVTTTLPSPPPQAPPYTGIYLPLYYNNKGMMTTTSTTNNMVTPSSPAASVSSVQYNTIPNPTTTYSSSPPPPLPLPPQSPMYYPSTPTTTTINYNIPTYEDMYILPQASSSPAASVRSFGAPHLTNQLYYPPGYITPSSPASSVQSSEYVMIPSPSTPPPPSSMPPLLLRRTTSSSSTASMTMSPPPPLPTTSTIDYTNDETSIPPGCFGCPDMIMRTTSLNATNQAPMLMDPDNLSYATLNNTARYVQPPPPPPGMYISRNDQQQQEELKKGIDDSREEVVANNEGSGRTLRTLLQELDEEDESCIFIVRRIHKFGFRSPVFLREYFEDFGQVRKVLVAHSKQLRTSNNNRRNNRPNSNTTGRSRPASLGFILMKDRESVQRILAAGPTHLIADVEITVHPFENRHPDKVVNKQEDGI